MLQPPWLVPQLRRLSQRMLPMHLPFPPHIRDCRPFGDALTCSPSHQATSQYLPILTTLQYYAIRHPMNRRRTLPVQTVCPATCPPTCHECLKHNRELQSINIDAVTARSANFHSDVFALSSNTSTVQGRAPPPTRVALLLPNRDGEMMPSPRSIVSC